MGRGKGWLGRVAKGTIVGALALQLGGCGTILYPERRNQPAGKLDTDVVLLDGIGLLFFLIPGVIAFAVDFATGAIYLPAGERSRTLDAFGDVRTIPFEDRSTDPADLAALVEQQTGLPIRLEQGRSWRLEGATPADVAAHVREANRAIAGERSPSG